MRGGRRNRPPEPSSSASLAPLRADPGRGGDPDRPRRDARADRRAARGRGGPRRDPRAAARPSPTATRWSRASAAARRSTPAGSSASTRSPTRATTAIELLAPGDASRDPTPRSTATSATPPASSPRSSSADLERAGIRVEDKGAIVALHWRGAENEGEAESLASEIAADAEWRELVAHRGRKVLEIRPERRDQQGHRRRGPARLEARHDRALRRRRPHRRRRVRRAADPARGRRPRAHRVHRGRLRGGAARGLGQGRRDRRRAGGVRRQCCGPSRAEAADAVLRPAADDGAARRRQRHGPRRRSR